MSVSTQPSQSSQRKPPPSHLSNCRCHFTAVHYSKQGLVSLKHNLSLSSNRLHSVEELIPRGLSFIKGRSQTLPICQSYNSAFIHFLCSCHMTSLFSKNSSHSRVCKPLLLVTETLERYSNTLNLSFNRHTHKTCCVSSLHRHNECVSSIKQTMSTKKILGICCELL